MTRAAPHLAPVPRTVLPGRQLESVPPAALPDLLKPADVATLLGVTPGRVYQLIAANVLPSIRRGRSVRVPRLAYDRWLTSLADEAEAGLRR